MYEIIRNDVFLLTTKHRNMFLIDLLSAPQPNLRHALLSLISIVVSTLKGVEYLLTNDQMIVMTLIEILKSMPAKDDGSVNQRFLIAILQKISIKTDSVPILFDLKVIEWSLDFIARVVSVKPGANQDAMSGGVVFALDFDSALLANILHAKSTQTSLLLPVNRELTLSLINKLLGLIQKKNLPTSVLMHLLICLSYLNKDRF